MQVSIIIIILANEETLICPYIVAFQELCWEKQGLPAAPGGNVLSHCFTSASLASKPLTSPVSLAQPSAPGAECRSGINPQASYHPTAEASGGLKEFLEGAHCLLAHSVEVVHLCGWVRLRGLHPGPCHPHPGCLCGSYFPQSLMISLQSLVRGEMFLREEKALSSLGPDAEQFVFVH